MRDGTTGLGSRRRHAYAGNEAPLQIQVGYELVYDFPQPTPLILALNVHYSRASDMISPDHMRCEPVVPIYGYRDGFGNWCNRLVAPAGRVTISALGVVRDSGELDPPCNEAVQHQLQLLPEEVLVFLLGSRYCETDRLSETAWRLFGATPPGAARVQAVCDYVHRHIQFGYEHASATKTAWEVFNEPRGVCRDFTHLAIALLRALNIPTRYCTGYLGDIGLPPPYAPMDFAAWLEVYLGGAWHTFDPRNNVPRRGRILIARGRDAADVAIATTFGPCELVGFKVVTDEIPGAV
ncbi:MAG: transglutaminase [Polyangiaceae bacterium]|nr:transglutaminase [Polyangiaceae bacterium]